MKKFLMYRTYNIVNIISLILFPVFCFSQTVDAPSRFSYSGYVYDKASQKPLLGAKISVTNTESNKNVVNITSDKDGSYRFSAQDFSDIKVTVTMVGYKKAEKSFTKDELKRNELRIPSFYLDTTIKFTIQPSVPVMQSKEEFIERKLASVNLVPIPAAYDLLEYLNPQLRSRDSLMSNDNIILPRMPRVSGEIKRENKVRFEADKVWDRGIQNRLLDSMDKVIRILSDDILQYKINYENVQPEALKQMRNSMRTELQEFKEDISKTSKLKAEGIMELLTPIIFLQEGIIDQRALSAADYERLEMLWDDLSRLLISSRFKLFGKSSYHSETKNMFEFITVSQHYAAPARENEDIEMAASTGIGNKWAAAPFSKDEVGVFGFLIWGEEVTSRTRPDLAEPSSRYAIRYFKPAFAKDISKYKACSRNANVAIANLTRAKYGVEIYDTKEKKFVQPLYPFFTTEEAFTDRGYDALLIPDFKEIKYIPIRLK